VGLKAKDYAPKGRGAMDADVASRRIVDEEFNVQDPSLFSKKWTLQRAWSAVSETKMDSWCDTPEYRGPANKPRAYGAERSFELRLPAENEASVLTPAVSCDVIIVAARARKVKTEHYG
jgi:hypothetical protein